MKSPQRWHDELAPAIERVWLDGIEGIRADLREWLRRAADDPEHWRPEWFELGFGLSDRAHRIRTARRTRSQSRAGSACADRSICSSAIRPGEFA